MEDAYCRLHELGYAHSVETWHDNKLVGGLYGVAIGRIFCGESMFSKETDASKMALVHLVRQLQDWGYLLIDCQLHTTHLASLGAEEISRDRYLNYLKQGAIHQAPAGVWPKQVK
jgi:leucyl/phenylalanyl-tRNA--protein transferase